MGQRLADRSLGLLVGMILRQRAAQRAVQAATDFASAALDATGGLVVITDRQGAIVRFNRACERVAGKTVDEVKGKTVWDCRRPGSAGCGLALWEPRGGTSMPATNIIG